MSKYQPILQIVLHHFNNLVMMKMIKIKSKDFSIHLPQLHDNAFSTSRASTHQPSSQNSGNSRQSTLQSSRNQLQQNSLQSSINRSTFFLRSIFKRCPVYIFAIPSMPHNFIASPAYSRGSCHPASLSIEDARLKVGGCQDNHLDAT